MIGRNAPKAMLIGTQGIRRHICISAVVLCSRRRMPIPESIQLLGIDREDGESSLQKGFHHRASWNLDGHGDPPRLTLRQLLEATQELGDGLAGVVDAALSKDFALGIH